MTDLASIFTNFALPWLGGFWAKFGAIIIKWALIAIILAGIFLAGKEYQVRLDLKDKAVQAQTITKTLVKEVVRRDEHEHQLYLEGLATTTKLAADKAALQTKLDHLKDMVNLYVPKDNVGAYVSPCAVSLLNSAAAGLDTSPGKGDAAGLATCADTGAGSLTWREFVQREIDLRGQYNTARSQSNQLIDWVTKNIVNAPITPATKTTQTPN